MPDDPLRALLWTFESVSNCLLDHLYNLISKNGRSLPTVSSPSPFSRALTSKATIPLLHPNYSNNKGISFVPVTREDLGRATWTFLHSLAAQYPENPTRQQKKDIKELMAILCRMYPCKECADHFRDILSANPVQTSCHAHFSQWLCHVHNTVNRCLGKFKFPCEHVGARWGKLECEQHACDLRGSK